MTKADRLDVAIARRRLAEVRRHPKRVVRGSRLRRLLQKILGKR